MHANLHSDEAEPTGEPEHVSSLLGTSSLTYSAVEQDGAPVQGTVEARIGAEDRHFYARSSETLIRGAPLPIVRRGDRPRTTQLRAKDLIDELRTINTQIHQIMFQVEKAVARLATGG